MAHRLSSAHTNTSHLHSPSRWGSNSASDLTAPRPIITRVSGPLGLICHRSSRQRPHGAKTCPSRTATIMSISASRNFNISATAACSAQKPIPHSVSTQMPVYTLPDRDNNAAATLPAVHDGLARNSPASSVAIRTRSASVTRHPRFPKTRYALPLLKRPIRRHRHCNAPRPWNSQSPPRASLSLVHRIRWSGYRPSDSGPRVPTHSHCIPFRPLHRRRLVLNPDHQSYPEHRRP